MISSLVFANILWHTIDCLPALKSVTIQIPNDQQDLLKSTFLTGAACLFFGGPACQNDAIPLDIGRQLNGNAKISTGESLLIPILKPILGAENIDSYKGTDVNIGEPRVNTGAVMDVLGIFQSQQGVRDAGIRGRGNYGAGWGDYKSVLGNLVGFGDVNDVNFNADQLRLDTERRAGLKGIYEETFRTIVDPLNLKVDKVKEICYGRLLFGGKGICTLENGGLAPQ